MFWGLFNNWKNFTFPFVYSCFQVVNLNEAEVFHNLSDWSESSCASLKDSNPDSSPTAIFSQCICKRVEISIITLSVISGQNLFF